MEAIYARFTAYDSTVLTTDGSYTNKVVPVDGSTKFSFTDHQFFKLTSFATDIEQTLNIGSQSTGAGAGKITFNPFSIVRKMDAASPSFFKNSASGTPFKTVEVFIDDGSSVIRYKQTYKLVAVKTISWSADAANIANSETISFEYGGLVISVYITVDNRTTAVQHGWNRIRNVSDDNPDSVIS